MTPSRKSEWVPVLLDSERSKEIARSWFSPLCDDMTPVKAEILVDIDTDAEKKLRVWMLDKNNQKRQAIRTRTKGGWTVTLKRPQP